MRCCFEKKCGFQSEMFLRVWILVFISFYVPIWGSGAYTMPIPYTLRGQNVYVKFTQEHAMTAQRGRTGFLYSFFNLCAGWGWVDNAMPQPIYHRYPLHRGLGRPQGPSGREWVISPPPRFDPRTFQPLASRYTAYVIRAPRRG